MFWTVNPSSLKVGESRVKRKFYPQDEDSTLAPQHWQQSTGLRGVITQMTTTTPPQKNYLEDYVFQSYITAQYLWSLSYRSTASLISLIAGNSKVREAALPLVLRGSYGDSKSVKLSKQDDYVRYYTTLSSTKITLTTVTEHIRADTAVTFAPRRLPIFSAKCRRKKEWVRRTGGMILPGEMRSTGRKPRYGAILGTIIPKWLVWEN